MRDDFQQKIKQTLARRVGFRCSNPSCRRLTVGPTEDVDRSLNIGVAAHITAASPGGPRYKPSLSPEERASPENGIWLCQNCAKLVDADATRFTVQILHEWKRASEELSRAEVEQLSHTLPQRPILALYCSWDPSPIPGKSGFILHLENSDDSLASARDVRVVLSLYPQLPILGLARPIPGSGWFEGIYEASESLEPRTLHPGESRPLARLLRIPGTLVAHPPLITLQVAIMATDCNPVKGTLSIPVWPHGQSIPESLAERTMILTNAVNHMHSPEEEVSVQSHAVQTPSPVGLLAIQEICNLFRQLLESNPKEQAVQRFFEANPILFHQFAPNRIIAQAPVLSTFRTDFAVHSKNGELFLIELEAPGTKLITRAGHPTAAYTHALHQVLDWLHEFESHYAACLSSLHLLPSDVMSVQGVVIAGREDSYSNEQLKRLKWARQERVRFLTYDDVWRSVDSLRESVAKL